MRLLCRYAGGLACLVTALALVACGAGPGSTKAQDPVGFKNIEVRQGSTSEISLVNTFSGSELTYKATSDKPSVATVTVDNEKDTLTVTAVGPGTATIEVTATDPQERSHSQDFTVTVPKPKPEEEDDEEEEAAPTVRTDATTSVDVAQGGTHPVTLSTVFDGANLSYMVSSSPDTVATASESNGTLTITARSPGPATITIVATNDAGTVTHQIEVTVTAPVTTTPDPPTPTSSTLTIELGESEKHTLAAGQALQGPADKGVTVGPSSDGATGNVWLITAKKKGIHKVTVLSAGKAVGTITVEVPNSRPVHQDPMTAGDPPVPLGNLKIPLTSAKGTVNLTPDGTGTDPDITDYFHDDDTADTIRYRIEDKPSWFLVETENGFLKDANGEPVPYQLSYEVLQKVVPSNERDYEFTVSLYASDGEEEATRPVVIEFSVGDTISPDPIPDYYVDQDASGNFRDGKKDGSYNNRLEVGPRREVTHTAIFRGTAGTLSESGFVFVENAHEDIASADRPTNETPSIFYKDGRNADKLVGGTAADIPTGYQDPGTRYFLIRGSSAVVVEGDASDSITIGASAKVSFSLKSGSSGSIIIEYKIWLNKGVVTGGENDGKTTSTKSAATKTLTISVLNCSSPPNPLSDCP